MRSIHQPGAADSFQRLRNSFVILNYKSVNCRIAKANLTRGFDQNEKSSVEWAVKRQTPKRRVYKSLAAPKNPSERTPYEPSTQARAQALNPNTLGNAAQAFFLTST